MTLLNIYLFLYLVISAEVKDYFGHSKPYLYGEKSYEFKWSDRPIQNYFIQEYFTSSETADNYTKMITISVIVGKMTNKEVAGSKISEIKDLMKRDEFVRFSAMQLKESNDILVDFIMRGSVRNKKVVEFNAIRFRTVQIDSVLNAVIALSYTSRGVGKKSKQFLEQLRDERLENVKLVATNPFPTVDLDALKSHFTKSDLEIIRNQN